MKITNKKILLVCISGLMKNSFVSSESMRNLRYTPETVEMKDSDLKQISMFGQDVKFKKTRDVSIVFMGDSLLRYQYLSLVHFLRSDGKKWLDADTEWENPVREQTFDNWKHFMRVTNSQLSPYEKCDCYRNEGVFKWEYLPYITENRFYVDEERNNNLAYIQKYGRADSHWSWDPAEVHNINPPNNGVKEDQDMVHHVGAGDWVTTIRDFLGEMSPKYKVLFFNAGHWKHDLKDLELQDRIVEEIRKAGMISVYRTTTKMQGQEDDEMWEYEQIMCKKVDFCLDYTWTRLIPNELYWDNYHFYEPVYRLFNTQLLGMLEDAGVF